MGNGVRAVDPDAFRFGTNVYSPGMRGAFLLPSTSPCLALASLRLATRRVKKNPKVDPRLADEGRMKPVFLPAYIRKVAAVALATLALSTLAHAGNGQGNNSDNGNGKGRGNGGPASGIPAVPEANAGWVLLPVVAGVLFFSTRRLGSAKVTANPEGQKGTR